MTILPLYAAPQYAPQVTDWLWQDRHTSFP